MEPALSDLSRPIPLPQEARRLLGEVGAPPRLVAHLRLVHAVTEEILRWASPVLYFRRNATHDIEVGGQRIAEGEKISLWYISANRDEEVFEDPFRFDIRRDPNPHVAFGGGGSHFCLGNSLARLELTVEAPAGDPTPVSTERTTVLTASDADEEVRRDGRSAVLRRAAAAYLQRKRRRTISTMSMRMLGASSTTMAAEVESPNALRDFRDHVKMMAGRAVYSPWRVSTNPRLPVAKNVGAPPIRRSGAASPRARPSARMVPVSTPGAAYGSTWLLVTSHRVAPTPNPASRMPRGTARIASAEVMMTMGRTRMAMVRPPLMRLRPPVTPLRSCTKMAAA